MIDREEKKIISIDFFFPLPLFGMTLFINPTDSLISQSDIGPDQAGTADANDHAWKDDDDMITEKPKKRRRKKNKIRFHWAANGQGNPMRVFFVCVAAEEEKGVSIERD